MRGIKGFTLVEVVLAIGVVAIAVASALAILPHLSRQSAINESFAIAHRIPALVRSELIATASSSSIESLGQSLPPDSAAESHQLLVNKDGSKIISSSSVGTVDARDAYYLVDVWRFSEAALAFNTSVSESVVVKVRISWPYRTPASSEPTAVEERHQITLAMGIHR